MERSIGPLCALLLLTLAVPAHAQIGDDSAPVLTSLPGLVLPQVAAPATVPQSRETYAVAQGAAPPDSTRSLFAPTWNTFRLLGRVSSIEGDAARWQRYEDLRDGLLLTNARLMRETPSWSASGGADNVGWRDQRYFGDYERIGRFRASGLWDQIPQFYSVDTKTPFTAVGEGILVLDDAAQRVGSNNAYLGISPQFDLREKRDIGNFRASATPNTSLDLTGGFTTTKHSGELPWGASFGFSNDNELALPYKSRTNDFDLGASWTNSRAMIRAGYNGSWFDNQDQTLTWDNPLVLNDSTTAPGHGRTALWPSNSLQTLSTAGYAKFAGRSQVTGSLAFGWFDNNEPLLPFTINSALPQFALPRATAEASAHTVATNVNLVSRPKDAWRMSARFRRYDYNNDMPETSIPQFINYDTSVATSPTGGPELLAHSRNTFDADATWTGIAPFAFTVGYTNNHNGYDHRIFESNNENILRLTADAVGSQWVTFRANYEYGSRSGSGLDEASLDQIGEQPQMRHYDLANRTRNRFTGQADVLPTEALTFSIGGGVGSDNFDDSYFGLQQLDSGNVSFSADYTFPRDIGAGATYNYERYTGLQQSRSANPGDQQNDPNRDWTTDSKETVHYISVYVQPPQFGKTEARLTYDYSNARGRYVYNVGPALPPPSQLPETYNKLQDLRLDVRHRLGSRWAANFNYVYEPYKIFDFAFDPSVINSIAQPSSLVLGYVYRPYTAHTWMFGILYYW
jgi:MtrB/PioB family decaheme-associated outer membrane protein